jgi:peptidyl-prolyl cis-trans isomerase SurA
MRMRVEIPRGYLRALSLALACALAGTHFAPAQSDAAGQAADKPQPLDSVIAVVNKQVILASDLDLEMRVFRLLPLGDRHDFTRAKALERLITRALIEQQIVQEDPHGLEISPQQLQDSLTELRQSLPACKLRDCATSAGWAAYLTTLGLTPERVSDYWAQRIAMLAFIELRFRSGNRVSPEEIQKYYREQLVPKYARAGDAPALEKISPRIEEILLQQKVNSLLGDWLKSLQDQGQVEILDPTLRTAAANASSDAPSPEKGGGP